MSTQGGGLAWVEGLTGLGSGGSTLGPPNLAQPPHFFHGNLGLTCLHQFILYCTRSLLSVSIETRV